MANIRQYTRKKNETQKNTIEDYRKKIAKYKVGIFYRILMTLFIGSIALLFIYLQIKNRVYTTYEIVSQVERVAGANTKCMNFADNILTYSQDGANCMDLKGNVIWNQTYQMQNPIVGICENKVVIGDYNGNIIYLMDTQGMISEIQTNLPIRKLTVSATGVIAVVLDDASITWISLYKPDGTQAASFKTTMKSSGYPADVDISNNGMLVGVSYLYADSGQLKTRVAFYNFDAVGQNQTDNLVSGYDYSDVIAPEIEFMTSELSFAIADKRLMLYKGKQIPETGGEVMLKEEIRSVYYSDKYIGLVYHNATGESKYKLEIYNDGGKLIHTQNFDMEYKEVIFTGEQFIIHNDLECSIYNMSGVEKFSGTFTETILTLIPTGRINTIICVTQNEVQTIELR